MRARIVRLAADGVPVAEIARRLFTTRVTVRKWCERFALAGLEALADLPRSGRPPRVPLWVRCELVKLACIPPERKRVRFRRLWTRAELRALLQRETGYRLSLTEIGRILRADGMRPHHARPWLHSPDPDFRRKVRAICELYTRPPSGATVLCIDEKTCIQALARRHPLRLPAPGRAGRVEFEYRRLGRSGAARRFRYPPLTLAPRPSYRNHLTSEIIAPRMITARRFRCACSVPSSK